MGKQIIKKELEAKLPTIKFSVRAENYAGGNSVIVSFDKGKSAPTIAEVDAVSTNTRQRI